MPELSRFYGIIIRMFFEASEPHHTPHFHAYYQEQSDWQLLEQGHKPAPIPPLQ